MMNSEHFAAVAAALGKAQGAFPTIPRDRLVTVRMKSGGSYTFRYAPLETILAAVRAPLAENELALVQSIVSESVDGVGMVESVRTMLIHSSGEWLACDVPVFAGTGDNRSQAYMSGVTYSRRYGVTLLLCVSADEDDDGNGGEQNAPRPDYVRQERNGRHGDGGRVQGYPQRRSGKPAREPQGPPPDPRDELDQTPPFEREDGATEVPPADPTDPYGDGLTPGQMKSAQARAKAAHLSDAQVLALVGGQITPANIGEALAKLTAAMKAAMQVPEA